MRPENKAEAIRRALPTILPNLTEVMPELREIVEIIDEIVASRMPWHKRTEMAVLAQHVARLTFVERTLREFLGGTELLDQANYDAALHQLGVSP